MNLFTTFRVDTGIFIAQLQKHQLKTVEWALTVIK